MVCKPLPQLASKFDGEVVATARAINRTLKSAGCSWHDLVSKILVPLPKPEPAPQAREGEARLAPPGGALHCLCAPPLGKPRGAGAALLVDPQTSHAPTVDVRATASLPAWRSCSAVSDWTPAASRTLAEEHRGKRAQHPTAQPGNEPIVASILGRLKGSLHLSTASVRG
jgi:hypothetical protein